MLIMIYIVLINSVISVLLIVYLVLLYKGSIRDIDKNFVPDELEEKASLFKKYTTRVVNAFKSLFKVISNKNV
jgi:hypothetical protein